MFCALWFLLSIMPNQRQMNLECVCVRAHSFISSAFGLENLLLFSYSLPFNKNPIANLFCEEKWFEVERGRLGTQIKERLLLFNWDALVS